MDVAKVANTLVKRQPAVLEQRLEFITNDSGTRNPPIVFGGPRLGGKFRFWAVLSALRP